MRTYSLLILLTVLLEKNDLVLKTRSVFNWVHCVCSSCLEHQHQRQPLCRVSGKGHTHTQTHTHTHAHTHTHTHTHTGTRLVLTVQTCLGPSSLSCPHRNLAVAQSLEPAGRWGETTCWRYRHTHTSPGPGSPFSLIHIHIGAAKKDERNNNGSMWCFQATVVENNTQNIISVFVMQWSENMFLSDPEERITLCVRGHMACTVISVYQCNL